MRDTNTGAASHSPPIAVAAQKAFLSVDYLLKWDRVTFSSQLAASRPRSDHLNAHGPACPLFRGGTFPVFSIILRYLRCTFLVGTDCTLRPAPVSTTQTRPHPIVLRHPLIRQPPLVLLPALYLLYTSGPGSFSTRSSLLPRPHRVSASLSPPPSSRFLSASNLPTLLYAFPFGFQLHQHAPNQMPSLCV